MKNIGTIVSGSAARQIVRASVMALSLAVPASGALQAAQPPAPDNSKVNERDRQPSQVTADQQQNNRPDREITRQIRRALVADTSLSTYAHNIKVITQRGKVTLKGPVRTAEEKTIVEAKAAEVAGAANVTSQVSVTSTTATAKKAGA
jgi:hyperosmotically inducible periplasmic protein